MAVNPVSSGELGGQCTNLLHSYTGCMLVPELNQSQAEPCSLRGGGAGLGICSSGHMCLELKVRGWGRAPIVQCTLKPSHTHISGKVFV